MITLFRRICLCCLPLIISTISTLCAQNTKIPSGYPIPTAEELRAFPQSNPISIHVQNKPIVEVLDEISRQAGLKVECGFEAKNKTITLSMEKASFLAVLAEICHQGSWGMMEYQSSDGPLIKIGEDPPIRSYSIQGPLLLAWYGLATIKEYNFQDPQNLIPSTKYRLGIIKDPLSHVETHIDKALRDQPVTFILADGKQQILQSDHQPNIFASGVPTWQFLPRTELSGKTVTIEVTVPLLTPTRLQQGSLPWANAVSIKHAEAHVTLERAATQKEKALDTDISSPNFAKQYDIHEFSATFKLIHPDPAKLKDSPEGGVLAAHEVYLIGKNGARLKGIFNSASGISSPWDGYRYEVKFQSKDLTFVPKEFYVTWSCETRPFKIPFKLENVPLENK